MRRVGFVFFGVLLGLLVLADGATDPLDINALNTLFSSLTSPEKLPRWSSNPQDDPCGQQWFGVTCSGSLVTELHLSSLGLTGKLSYNLNNFKSLTVLDLSNNNIDGQMQYQLPPNLKRLDLSGNQLTGGLPYSISNLSSLEYLSVSRNQFKDPLMDMFSTLSSLSTIDLSQNAFTGSLPGSFRALSSLTSLYLQNNQFTGTVDVLGDLPLENLNIANNRFTGWIPGQLLKIKNFQSDGNQWNNGPAPPPPPFTPPPSPKGNQDKKSDGKTSGSGGKSGLSGGGIAGIITAVLVVGSIVAFFLIKRKSKRSHQMEKNEQRQEFTPVPSDENAGAKHFQIDVDPVTIVHTAPSPINIAPPLDRPKSSDEEDSTNQLVTNNINKFNTKAIAFSIADLQMATGSFSIDNLIGEGSIGRVYRAQFDDGKVLAVKKINSLGISQQASEGFMKVVSDVSQLHHPNVTELTGYCCEHGQYLLLYEFHRNGSLHDFLHLSDEYNKPLTWKTRVKIALGTARALEYLHEVCSPSMVHKNFKSANILLDAELNPHLSDCGLSGLTSDNYQALDQYLGSGYSAPEVAMTGQYTLKSDVFSFGVVMLELLTGRKPFDSSRSRLEQSLVRWATPQLHDIDALDKMVDPALKGLYPAKSLSRFADAIALCVQSEPEFRPPMSEVVQALVRLVQRANMSKRMGAGDEQGRGDEANMDTF